MTSSAAPCRSLVNQLVKPHSGLAPITILFLRRCRRLDYSRLSGAKGLRFIRLRVRRLNTAHGPPNYANGVPLGLHQSHPEFEPSCKRCNIDTLWHLWEKLTIWLVNLDAKAHNLTKAAPACRTQRRN